MLVLVRDGYLMLGWIVKKGYREMVKQLLGLKTLPATFPFAGDPFFPCLICPVFTTNTANIPAKAPCQLRVLLLYP